MPICEQTKAIPKNVSRQKVSLGHEVSHIWNLEKLTSPMCDICSLTSKMSDLMEGPKLMSRSRTSARSTFLNFKYHGILLGRFGHIKESLRKPPKNYFFFDPRPGSRMVIPAWQNVHQTSTLGIWASFWPIFDIPPPLTENML